MLKDMLQLEWRDENNKTVTESHSVRDWMVDWWYEARFVPTNDQELLSVKQNGTEQKRTGRLQFDDLMKELGADTFHRQYVEDTDQEGTAEGFWKWLEAQEDLTFILPTAITGTMADTPFGPYKATDLLALLFWTATGKPECRMTEMDQAVWNWIRKSYKYGLLCEETAAREDWKRLRMALFIGNTPLIAPIIEKGTICSHGECWDRKDLRQILAELKNQNIKRSKAEMASLIWLLAPILDPEAAGLRLFEDPITERLLKQLNAYTMGYMGIYGCGV